jgi:N-methylhydantoinase B
MSSLIQHLLTRALEDFDSGAILNQKGEVLSLKYENLVDIGTLSASAQTILKYFPLKKGDAVILNDPYSGGSVLSTISLMTPLANGLYIIIRTGFRQHLSLAQKVDEEGLRIPPTPIATAREIHFPILQAMAEHPLAPDQLQNRIQDYLKKLFLIVDQFEKVQDYFSNEALENYMQQSRDQFKKLLDEEPYGETSLENKLQSGEILKLKLHHSSSGLILNFSGTSASKRLCLTDAGTFGACVGALIAYLHKNIPLNSGLFSMIQVESPLGSLLNARYPSPTFLGMTEGAAWVAKTVLLALNKLSHHKNSAESASMPVMIHLKFKNGRMFFENIPGGTGASHQQDGADALHFWIRNSLETSVEEIERRFPLLILQMGIRQGSGGKGQFCGGNGMTREYEILEPAELCWLKDHSIKAQQGSAGGLHGQSPEIYIIRNNEKILCDSGFGTLQLQPHDKLFASSAGGGGYGKLGK